MKDPFTSALCDVVQNQIEFVSTAKFLLEHAQSSGGAQGEISRIQDMLEDFNQQTHTLTRGLVALHDKLANQSRATQYPAAPPHKDA